jgi:hypothetical protein
MNTYDLKLVHYKHTKFLRIENTCPRKGQKIFLLAPASRPALGPTQPPIQLVPGVKRGRGVMLTTHPHLVPRLSMSRSYTSSPPMCLHGM